MLPRRALSAFLLGVASALAFPAGTARADDPAPAPESAVARLQPAEIEILRRKFSDWEQKDAAERERIAANVLRLRNLSAAERAKVFERVKQAEQRGVLEHLRDRLDKMKPEFRRKAVEGHLLARALFTGVLKSLPPASRAAFSGGPASLSPEQRAFVEQAIVTAWWKRATEAQVPSPPLEAAPAAGSSPEETAAFVKARDEVVRAGGASAPVEKRKAYAAVFVRNRVGALLRAAHKAVAPGDPRAREGAIAAVAASVGEAFPGTVEGLGRSVSEAAENGAEGLVQWVWQQEFGIVRSPQARMRRLVDLLVDLEKTLALLGRDVSPELRGKVEDLQRQILVESKVPEADAKAFLEAKKAFLEAKTPWERLRALQSLRRLLGARDKNPEKGPPAGPFRGRGAGK